MHVTIIRSGLFKASSQGKHFVTYRGAGGREGIIFYLKLISALSFFSITCMKNNEDYFVTLIDKYVNRTTYLIFYIMSSAICIWTSVVSMAWNMILSFPWIVSSCGTQKFAPSIWQVGLPRCPAVPRGSGNMLLTTKLHLNVVLLNYKK